MILSSGSDSDLDYIGLGWSALASGQEVISDDGEVRVVHFDRGGSFSLVDPDVSVSRWSLRWMLWHHARDILKGWREVPEFLDWQDRYASPVVGVLGQASPRVVDRGPLEIAFRRRAVSAKPVLSRDFSPSGRTDREPVYRVLKCHGSPGQDVEIWRDSKSEGRALWHKVFKCGDFWTCPVCSQRITQGRRDELKDAFEEVVARRGGSAYLVTFTVPHDRFQRLDDLLRQILYARARLDETRFGKLLQRAPGPRSPERVGHKYVGRIRTLEFTWSAANGWHPHLHEAWIFSEALTVSESRVFEVLPDAWGDCCEDWWLNRPGPAGVDARPIFSNVEYLSKFGLDRTWGAHYELASGSGKRSVGPWALLERSMGGDPVARAAFLEYVRAVKDVGPSSIHVGGRLSYALRQCKLGFRGDDDLATRIENDAELIAALTPRQYRWVSRHEQFANVLRLAEQLGGGVSDWIDEQIKRSKCDVF